MGDQSSCWARVMNCAVSNSLFYNDYSDGKIIKDSASKAILQFIQTEGHLSAEEAEVVLMESIERANTQKKNDVKYPIWAIAGITIGIIGLIMNVVNIAFVGFDFLFIIFIITATGIVTASIDCIRKTYPIKKSVMIWHKAYLTDNIESLTNALQQMKEFLS